MKHISLLAAILLLLSVFVTACGGDSGTASETAPRTDTMANNTGAEGAENTLMIDSLTAQDFGGASFRIFTSNVLSGLEMPTTINYAADETGEIVNDTLFARDIWLTETYNVDVQYTVDNESGKPQRLTLLVLSGDDVHDLIIEDLATVARSLAESNCSYPLNYIDTIRLDQSYWMPELNKQLMIGDNLFFSASPLSPRYYGSVYLIMFNRDLAEDLHLPDFYKMVTDGTWTLDVMMECARVALSDTNGDGIITAEDTVGFIYEVLTPETLVMASGYHYVQNVGGSISVMLEDPAVISLMQKIANFLQEDCVALKGYGSTFDVTKAINNGTSLFYNPATVNLAGYRELPYDYGILPIPKDSVEQESYISYSQPWASACPTIPITVVGDRLDMTGTLTDAMAAYGFDYIRPAVFDNVIQLKGTRDEKSSNIINMMFENITFELTSILNFDSLNAILQDHFTRSLGKRDIVSVYASIKESTENAIAAIEEQYANFEKNLGK
jgi:ABC-type glycerol-3-phosphate transport system substrate-binding protein